MPTDASDNVFEILEQAIERARLRGYPCSGFNLQWEKDQDGDSGYVAWLFWSDSETEYPIGLTEEEGVAVEETPLAAALSCAERLEMMGYAARDAAES